MTLCGNDALHYFFGSSLSVLGGRLANCFALFYLACLDGEKVHCIVWSTIPRHYDSGKPLAVPKSRECEPMYRSVHTGVIIEL